MTCRSRVFCKKVTPLGAQAKIEVAPGAKKALRAVFGPGARLQFSLCAMVVPLRAATFLQMTRLLQVINSKHVLNLGRILFCLLFPTILKM